jgi:hypothetical protein
MGRLLACPFFFALRKIVAQPTAQLKKAEKNLTVASFFGSQFPIFAVHLKKVYEMPFQTSLKTHFQSRYGSS